MSPENQWLEDAFPTEIVPFLGAGDMLVFRGVIQTHVPHLPFVAFCPLLSRILKSLSQRPTLNP